MRQELFDRKVVLTLALFNLDAQSKSTYDPDVGRNTAGPGSHRITWRTRSVTMNRFHVFAAALTASLMWSAPSFSHAMLRSSIPAANARLARSPPALTLNFSEEAQLAVLKLTSSGTAIPVTLDHNAKASSAIVVTLPALKPGTYDVQWSAIAQDDGHVTKGTFSFTVLGS